MSTKKSAPLLWDTELAEDTESDLESLEQADITRAMEDPNWIPGYSEYVRAEALGKAEYGSMSYQQRDHQFRMLGIEELRGPPIHIKPVRAATLDGKVNDNVLLDLSRHKALGYKMMTLADLERYGMKMPPLYTIAADGTIRRGDSALMFVDAQRAKRNELAKLEAVREREGSTSMTGESTGVHIDFEMSRDPNFSL